MCLRIRNLGAETAGRRGFTLIEMLIVIAIIAILTTIGFSSYSAYGEYIKKQQTRNVVQLAQNALLAYVEVTGSVPPVSTGSAFTALLPYLYGEAYTVRDAAGNIVSDVPGAAEVRRRIPGKLTCAPQNLTRSVPGQRFPEIIDAWGNPLVYRCWSSYTGIWGENVSLPEVISCGPDGKWNQAYADRPENADNIAPHH